MQHTHTHTCARTHTLTIFQMLKSLMTAGCLPVEYRREMGEERLRVKVDESWINQDDDIANYESIHKIEK